MIWGLMISIPMMVAATMTLPLVESLGPTFAALACAVGPVGFSHLNDSYFYIISRSPGINNLADQLQQHPGFFIAYLTKY